MTDEWKKIFISPQKFHDDIIKLTNLIPKNKYKYVTGIPRGGLIPATYISHFCELEFISYRAEIFKFFEEKLSEILLVDDLTDTGLAITEIISYINSPYINPIDTAVVYYKPRSAVNPTYYVEEVKNSDWLVFPFEQSDETPNREV